MPTSSHLSLDKILRAVTLASTLAVAACGQTTGGNIPLDTGVNSVRHVPDVSLHDGFNHRAADFHRGAMEGIFFMKRYMEASSNAEQEMMADQLLNEISNMERSPDTTRQDLVITEGRNWGIRCALKAFDDEFKKLGFFQDPSQPNRLFLANGKRAGAADIQRAASLKSQVKDRVLDHCTRAANKRILGLDMR